MEDLYPNLRKLQQADQKRLQSIEECEGIIAQVKATANSNSESLVQVFSALELKKGQKGAVSTVQEQTKGMIQMTVE